MRRMTRRRRRRLRSGATLVETALVLSVLLLFLFAIFEYGRYLLVNQMLANAARDGARYAATNVDKSSAFVTTAESGRISIKDYVIQECKGADKWVDAFTVDVFPCDDSDTTGAYANPPQIKPKSGWPSTVQWNNASFTDRLAVRITCVYRPVLPVVWVPQAGQSGFKIGFYGSNSNAVPLTIVAATGSEG
jgi:Flp pilus assembly protein TadG